MSDLRSQTHRHSPPGQNRQRAPHGKPPARRADLTLPMRVTGLTR